MSDYAAVNLITEGGQFAVLTHRWGGAFENIIPQIMDAARTAADTKTMAANLIALDDDFTPETVTETDLSQLLISQRHNNLLSYNLYVRKGGWDIEVWSNGGYTLVLNNDGVSATFCPIRMNAQVIIDRKPLQLVTKKDIKAANAMLAREDKRVVKLAKAALAAQRKVIATYVIGETGEGKTSQPMICNGGPNAHVECLKNYCTETGGRPVGYIHVRLKDDKPQYMYTYFFPKHEGCTQAGCTGVEHEPKNAADVNVMMTAIDFIKKASNGTGIQPVQTAAAVN
jgi:hypothetical protein